MEADLGNHVYPVLMMWTVVMVVVGGVSTIIVFLLPKMRSLIPSIVSILLGLIGLGIFGFVAAPQWHEIWPKLLMGFVPSELLTGVSSWIQGLWIIFALVAAFLIALAAFWLEKVLLRIPKKKNQSLMTLGLPDRKESMDSVERVASRTGLFMGLSIWCALGEEFLFRGGMLVVIWASTVGLGITLSEYWYLIMIQGILFGFVHIAFGMKTIFAKSLLGIGLSLTGLVIGLPLGAILPHVFYQILVLKQFRVLPAKKNTSESR